MKKFRDKERKRESDLYPRICKVFVSASPQLQSSTQLGLATPSHRRDNFSSQSYILVDKQPAKRCADCRRIYVCLIWPRKYNRKKEGPSQARASRILLIEAIMGQLHTLQPKFWNSRGRKKRRDTPSQVEQKMQQTQHTSSSRASAKLSHEDFWFYIVKRMNWDAALSHPARNIGKKSTRKKKPFSYYICPSMCIKVSFGKKGPPFDFRDCKKDWTAKEHSSGCPFKMQAKQKSIDGMKSSKKESSRDSFRVWKTLIRGSICMINSPKWNSLLANEIPQIGLEPENYRLLPWMVWQSCKFQRRRSSRTL